MYLRLCLLVHVICLNLVSCRHTGYSTSTSTSKCENTCDNVTSQPSDTRLAAAVAVSEQNALFGQSITEPHSKHGNAIWSRLKKQFKSFDVLRLTLKKALFVLRKIWNSDRASESSPLKNHLDNGISKRFHVQQQEEVQNEARTFGIRRRMQLFLMLPISFKLGVIVTLLLVLTVMSLKGLIIGFLILLLILANTHTYSKLWGVGRTSELSESLNRNVPVHVHVHALLSDDYNHRPSPYIEHSNSWPGHSSGYVYQTNWHESPTNANAVQVVTR
ncbi:uncharacterized protein LOC135843856 [Planococcus citri]|uniref:uncharacterized protein LOC135843856 n=1 Tax=Planococcus citri TaxID=170843 RepID=UPI0031F9931D